jgi:mevalonate kinase
MCVRWRVSLSTSQNPRDQKNSSSTATSKKNANHPSLSFSLSSQMRIAKYPPTSTQQPKKKTREKKKEQKHNDSSSMKASAPAKLILFGEHAVVYGKHALACALSLRVTATTITTPTRSSSGGRRSVSLTLPGWTPPTRSWPLPLDPPTPAADPAEQVFLSMVRHFSPLSSSLQPPSFRVVVENEIPRGAGLGSSGALSVALAGTLSAHFGGGAVLDEVNCAALELGERVFHATPSAAAAAGMARVSLVPRLRALVVDTGVARATRTAVALVAARLERDRDAVTRALDRIDQITLAAARLLSASLGESSSSPPSPFPFNELEALVDENHSLLVDVLGVGHEAIDRAVAIARSHGLHAKITGAGLGGCVFAFIPPSWTDHDISLALHSFIAAGFAAFSTSLGGKGLEITRIADL